MYRKVLKPFGDWTLALITLIILMPLFLIVTIAIKIDNRGPVFFVQKRLGKNGKVFNLIKFRSMANTSDNLSASKYLFENDPRITRVGRYIRKTSIDELPQLVNILKGEMSFIGPRPPTIYYPKSFSDYNCLEKERFAVKPGISGLAQIRCREEHNWDVNIPIDIEYVRNFSFTNDLKLFLFSFLVFFRTDNVYRREIS